MAKIWKNCRNQLIVTHLECDTGRTVGGQLEEERVGILSCNNSWSTDLHFWHLLSTDKYKRHSRAICYVNTCFDAMVLCGLTWPTPLTEYTSQHCIPAWRPWQDLQSPPYYHYITSKHHHTIKITILDPPDPTRGPENGHNALAPV